MNTVNIIFLSYINRSGSTYLANALDSSEEILACPEADILVRELLEDPDCMVESPVMLLERINKAIENDNKLRSWGLPQLDDEFLSEGARKIEVFVKILDCYRRLLKPAASNIVFKSERLIFLFYKLFRLKVKDFAFKGLWIVRDPRAVYYSQRNTMIPETRVPMNVNPVYSGLFWRKHTKAGFSMKMKFPVFRLRYEDLVEKFTESTESLAGFLDIPVSAIDPMKGNLHERIPLNHRKIHSTLNQEPIPEKVNEWRERLTLKEIALVEIFTSGTISKLEYKKTSGAGLIARITPLACYHALLFLCKYAGNIILFRFTKRLPEQDGFQRD